RAKVRPGRAGAAPLQHPLVDAAWVYVVDSPWYAEVGADGAFRVKAPPGDYVVAAWHEASSRTTRQKVTVGDDGATVDLTVGGDVKPPSVVPDKYGKPRQVQLGY